jgi:coenzyme F420-reducing hydrogenase gamma subunit
VTVLTRLADAFARLTESAATPMCLECRAPMALRREEAVGDLPVALERHYACGGCGARVSHCQLWAIPD